jgi:hypothetical protein
MKDRDQSAATTVGIDHDLLVEAHESRVSNSSSRL